MKYTLLFGMIISAFNLYASPISGDKFLSYQENYPKSPHWYEFKVDSFCKEYKIPISIQEFVSEKNYGGKNVRVVHIYADSNNKNCKNIITEKQSEKISIPVDLKRTTHVYVTYSSDLEITSGH